MVSIQFVTTRFLARTSLIAGACFALAACRGGSSLPPAAQSVPDSALSATHGTKPHAGIPVTVNLVVPTGKAALRRALGERSPFFVALGTKGAKVVAYAHGNRTTPLAKVVANVAANSSICSSGAARVCALKLSLQLGRQRRLRHHHLRPVASRQHDPRNRETARRRRRGERASARRARRSLPSSAA